jgi:hypothetical protein
MEDKFGLIGVTIFNQGALYIQGQDKTKLHWKQTSFRCEFV